MPSHLWHCYLPLPKQVTSHANNSDEALQQCQLLSQLLLELLVALLPLRIVAYGILRQMVSSSALKHQFLSWNMWGKKVRWTHGNKTKQRNTGSLHPWCNPWCNPYWPPLGCERQKSTVQFPLYIRKLGACPKQAFLPSTLSGEVFYFMLLLDSLEFAGRYCFVEFTWQPHFQQLLLQLPLLHLPSEQPDTPCTSSAHMASNVRPANAATICSYHQSSHQTWPDILG